MAAGDINASALTLCTGAAEITTALDLLNLAAVTDGIIMLPVIGSPNQYWVGKWERAAA